MKSHPRIAAARAAGPGAGSRTSRCSHIFPGDRNAVHAVVIAVPAVTTDATAPADATLRARRAKRRRRARVTGYSASAGSRSARRATRSATTVAAIALAAVATRALPYLPFPG